MCIRKKKRKGKEEKERRRRRRGEKKDMRRKREGEEKEKRRRIRMRGCNAEECSERNVLEKKVPEASSRVIGGAFTVSGTFSFPSPLFCLFAVATGVISSFGLESSVWHTMANKVTDNEGFRFS
jgi:hypothetical protein